MERTWVVRAGDDLGAAVAEIRRVRGLTQQELADRSGLSRHWLAKLENGRSAVVLDHLLRLLRRMGATVVVTFDEPEPEPPPRAVTDGEPRV
ncbi:MAG: helix-turn-helix domain-containing protein [Kineosporiaceae bacterium]